jgi:hypothetical protein
MQPRLAVAGTCGSTGLLQGLEAAKAKRPTADRIQLPEVYYRCTSGRTRGYCTYLSSSTGTRSRSCCRYCYTQPMTVLPGELESQKKEIIDKLVEDDLDVGKARLSTGTGQGFVRENITYMVTDNLEVMPSTTIRSSINSRSPLLPIWTPLTSVLASPRLVFTHDPMFSALQVKLETFHLYWHTVVVWLLCSDLLYPAS